MPQKNQEEQDSDYSNDEAEDQTNQSMSSYKIEKFENKYLEATELGGQAKKKGAWGGKEQNRMLKFLLTDGKTDIIAIEMEKLAYIHLETT